jgi:hypothetical protein
MFVGLVLGAGLVAYYNSPKTPEWYFGPLSLKNVIRGGGGTHRENHVPAFESPAFGAGPFVSKLLDKSSVSQGSSCQRNVDRRCKIVEADCGKYRVMGVLEKIRNVSLCIPQSAVSPYLQWRGEHFFFSVTGATTSGLAPVNGMITVRAEPVEASADLCIQSSSAAIRGCRSRSPLLADGVEFLELYARLVSSSSLLALQLQPIEPSLVSTFHEWAGNFSLQEPGNYIFEVYVGSERHTSIPGNLSTMGLSHQLISKMVYRQNGPSVALGPGHSSASKRACDHTDFLGVDSVASKGRWVNASLYINRHLFSGDPSIVSGECGYNPGFVWAPHHCTLHLPSKEELRSCLNRLNISALGVLAQDSLGREMGTNLIQLVANNSLNLDGRKLKVAQGELGGPISADFLIGDQRVIFTENFDDVDVSLIAINVVIQLGTRVDWANSTDFDSDLAKQALGWATSLTQSRRR